MNTPAPQPSHDTVASPAPAVATLRGVTKRYGDAAALAGVDLSLRRGEILAVLGPNGAGKTTAIRLLLGLARPTSGTVEVLGGDPRVLRQRRRMGAMLQESGLPETLKVREHLDLFRTYYPAPRPRRELMRLTGLESLAERQYGELSGGERQRLAFALAVCGNPRLLFLDEPTANLDVESRHRLWRAIRELADGGTTVVLTTHYLEEADRLADRVVLLARGQVITSGSPRTIKEKVEGRRIHCRTALPEATVRKHPDVLHLEVAEEPNSEAIPDRRAITLLARRAEPVVRHLLERDPDLSGLEVSGAALEDAFLVLMDPSNPQSDNPASKNQEVAA